MTDRAPLEMAMLAAWVNVPVDQLPETLRAPTCPATMEAWRRVGEAALAYYRIAERDKLAGELAEAVRLLKRAQLNTPHKYGSWHTEARAFLSRHERTNDDA